MIMKKITEYRLKHLPEDFIVDEKSSLPLKKDGEFSVFRLTKKNWNTEDALSFISRHFKLSPNALQYAGRKDRKALTSQWITVQSKKQLPKSWRDKDLQLEYEGKMDRPMGPDLILSNRFTVTLRNLSSEETEWLNNKRIPGIFEKGYVNYFDDQRFSGVDPMRGFLGEKIVQKHYNGALKIYACHADHDAPKEEYKRKQFFWEHWKDWPLCLSEANTAFEKKIFQELSSRKNAFLTLLQEIPGRELSFQYSVYQAFLWNETVRRYCLLAKKQESAPGLFGDYLFPLDLSSQRKETFLSLILPLMDSHKKSFPDKEMEKIQDAVLQERGVSRAAFNCRGLRQAFFKASERKLWIHPQAYNQKIFPDDCFSERFKTELSFELPRGSYATLLIKKIFAFNPETP